MLLFGGWGAILLYALYRAKQNSKGKCCGSEEKKYKVEGDDEQEISESSSSSDEENNDNNFDQKDQIGDEFRGDYALKITGHLKKRGSVAATFFKKKNQPS